MPFLSILFGVLLCGLSGFTLLMTGGGFKLGTWLIPAGFGVVLILLGVIARSRPGARKHAMHIAAMVGTIGALVSLSRGIPSLVSIAQGAEDVNMLAFGMVWGMAILCLTFVGACVQSFIAARKAREAREKETAANG